MKREEADGEGQQDVEMRRWMPCDECEIEEHEIRIFEKGQQDEVADDTCDEPSGLVPLDREAREDPGQCHSKQ